MDALTISKPAVSTEEEAISTVNGWLHREIGMALHATGAPFNRLTFCRHLPIESAYPKRGTPGILGDVYLQAATGDFVGQPDAEDLIKKAEKLADAFGVK